MKKLINKFDIYFINLINKKMKNTYLDRFMYKITDYGGAVGTSKISLILFIVGYFFNTKMSLIGLKTLISLAISQTIIQLIKVFVKRKRPYEAVKEINTYGIIMKDYSFPSGHTTASFTLFAIMFLNNSKFWFFGLIFAVIIGLSRIYLGLHYPTDVVFGMFFGIAGSIFIEKYLIFHVIDIIHIIIN